jgi:hypothetical protein
MMDVTTALMSSGTTFITGLPGAWSGVVAGIPGHGYLEPNGVGRLPVDPSALAEVVMHFRAFFPVMFDSGGPDPEAVVALVDGLPNVAGTVTSWPRSSFRTSSPTGITCTRCAWPSRVGNTRETPAISLAAPSRCGWSISG